MQLNLNSKLYLSDEIFDANIKKSSIRDGFGKKLVELGEKFQDLVVLTGDLSESTRVLDFAEKFPNRFIEVGIAEQNMAGIAAGLALSGKIPLIASYASFNPGRNWEQIKDSICYSNANVKIIGAHGGYSSGVHGATHQALEDIALTRVLPNMTVIVPADYIQTQKALEEAFKIDGPVYIRLARPDTPIFTTQKTPFSLGEPQVIKEGSDITIVSCGPLVYEALLAARELDFKFNIDAQVINCHTIKPISDDTIIKSVKKTNLVLTIEEHQIAGGLGSAISEFLSENYPVKIHRMGSDDKFGESGLYDELIDKNNLSKNHIIKRVREAVGKK